MIGRGSPAAAFLQPAARSSTILPNCSPDSSRSSASWMRSSVNTLSCTGCTVPRPQNSSSARNSCRSPSVEPMIWSWRMKMRRRSAGGWSPLVAPQTTRRPPRTSDFIAADQTACPTFSITRSTPRPLVSACTSRTTSCWLASIAWSAPRARARCSLAALREVTITRAPAALASCSAASETPPPMPNTSTVCQGSSRPLVNSMRQAVRWFTPSAAACAKVRPAGIANTLRAGRLMNSAKVPSRCSPSTAIRVHSTPSPRSQNSQWPQLTAGCSTTACPRLSRGSPASASSTTPAPSMPMICGSRCVMPAPLFRMYRSTRFSVAAFIRTSTSPGARTGTGRSPTWTASLPPCAVRNAAFIEVSCGRPAIGEWPSCGKVPDQFAQLEFLDLARRCRRHRVLQQQAFRHVRRRDLQALQVLGHRREVEALAGLGHDDRAGALAEPLVGVGDDRDLGDRRMLVEQRLDLEHRNVLAAADDHVLAAPGDADVAAGGAACQIAGVEPAIRIGRVPLRPLQVAAEVGRGAHQQPAHLAMREDVADRVDHLDLDAGKRAAVGRGGERVVVLRPDQRDRAVLGHPPGGDDLRAQHLARLLRQQPKKDRKSTRLNSSHHSISYAVFCLKKK